VLYYAVAVSYTGIAIVRSGRVAKSILLTVLLSCVAAIPFCYTASGFVSSLLGEGLPVADALTWVLIFILLAGELSLPLVLMLEFLVENERNRRGTVISGRAANAASPPGYITSAPAGTTRSRGVGSSGNGDVSGHRDK